MNIFQHIWNWRSTKDPMEKLMDELRVFERNAYLPQTQESERTFSTDSKIGGYPYLRSETDWPTCPNCQQHFQLFLQLDRKILPEQAQEGLIQLFYCTNQERLCAQKLDGFYAFSQAHATRLIFPKGPSTKITPQINEVFPEKRIIGWEAKPDYPHYEELIALGMELNWKLYDQLDAQGRGTPLMGDKLFGWPHWVQSPEYPLDRQTGSQMNMLFQLDSEVNLPFMFGDMGIGHLTQSPDNPEELAFGWACT